MKVIRHIQPTGADPAPPSRSRVQGFGFLMGLIVALASLGCAGSEDTAAAPTAPSDPTGPSAPTDPTGPFGVDAGYGRLVLPGQSVRLRATVAGGSAASLAWTRLDDGPDAPITDGGALEPTVLLPTDLSYVFRFEVTAVSAAGEEVKDTTWIESRRPGAADPDDLTALADFSARTGWACDQDPVAAPEVEIQELTETIAFTSNGIPPHATGTFPNPGNPNPIAAGPLETWRVPRTPVKTAVATEMAEFGVTLAGIKLDRDTGESYQNQRRWNYEALTPGMALELTGGARHSWLGSDCNNAHVQPGGAYHYHGPPAAYARELAGGGEFEDMVLLGYAADGFPFYYLYGYEDPMDPESGLVALEASWGLREGLRDSDPGGPYDGSFREDWVHIPGSGDLDECGGRFGVTPEFPEGAYHYYLTLDYPYVPRCVFGTPDPSFRRRGPGGPPPG